MMVTCDSAICDVLIYHQAAYNLFLQGDTLMASCKFGLVDASPLNREAIRRGYKSFIAWEGKGGTIRFEDGDVARCRHCRQLLPKP